MKQVGILVILVGVILLSVPQIALAGSNSTYDRAMKSFSAGDYRTAEPIFNALMRSDPDNANAVYMDALCQQQLGHTPVATQLFKICCERFPESAACVRAQSALQKLDPVYLRHFQTNRPAASPAGGIQGIGPLEGPGVAPDFSFGTEILTPQQQHYQLSLISQVEPVNGRLNGIWTSFKFAPGKQSMIGLNWLRASKLNFNPHSKVYRAEVKIERTRVAAFDFAVCDYTPTPIKLCNDFRARYEQEVAMANETTAHQYLATHTPKQAVVNPVAPTGSGGTPAGDDAPRPGEEQIEVPYRTTPDGHKIITVQVNGSSTDMIVFESGGMLMGLDQLRSIDPGAGPDLKVESVNNSVRSSGDVVFRSVSVGPLVRYQVPCHIEGWGNLRTQSNGGNPRDYPLLGDDFFANYRYVVQDDKRVIKVFRTIKSN
ncbi:MAG TPA: hypothetical protein V6C97_23005 [Oculatellaceae cyanobacterium]